MNYKETVSSIDTNDHITYGKDIVARDCQPHNYFVEENYGHILMGDLRIITNSKLIKLVSKGPNFREAMSINWNKCKREIEIELDLSITWIIPRNSKVTMEEFVKQKRSILQEVDNKIISIRHQIKVHKTNPALKQDTVIEYSNELHKKHDFLLIGNAANNNAIICVKSNIWNVLIFS